MTPRTERPRDPRMPHATYEDPRGGSGFRTPAGVAGAAAIGIGYAFGGPAGAVLALGLVLALAIGWWVVRLRRR